MEAITEFDPVLFNDAENNYIKQALGKPVAQALRDIPPGVNINAIRPLLMRIQEIQQLGESWCGPEVISAAIDKWQEMSKKWREDKKRGAPRFPSMFSYDSRGRAFEGGPGADQGRVRTYFDADGNRRKFAVPLQGEEQRGWTPDWVTKEATDGLIVDAAKKRIECPICGHTEGYNPDSRASFNAARARISKHLRAAKDEQDAHKELHTREFGQGRS